MSLAGSASAGTGQITRHFVRYFGANLPFGGNLERISNHRKNGCVGDFEIPATPYLWKTLQAEPHSGQSSSLSQSEIGILQFGQIHHLPSLK